MEFRSLAPAEHEAWLELLDLWDVGDGWRGRDFFRRYLEHEPGFRDENVHVAAEAGRLLACVQVFPRRLRLAGGVLPCGGIGSVFTHPEARRRGLGAALLRRAEAAMRADGLELGLLFAGPVPWYEQLGWRSLALEHTLLGRPTRPPAAEPRVELRAFERERDLAELCAVHAAATAERDGALVRDAALWEASLRVAGNPDEEIRVARREGRLVAHLRVCMLGGALVASEALHAPGGGRALAALIGQALAPRTPDPLAARAGIGIERDARAGLVLGALALDPELEAALSERGFPRAPLRESSTMLRALAPEALARRLGCPAPAAGEPAGEWLLGLAPAERFGFLRADRF